MNREGSTQAPIRHPIKFRDPDFIDAEKIDQEMRRVFDICHGCRRCFNLCDSFPIRIIANFLRYKVIQVRSETALPGFVPSIVSLRGAKTPGHGY